MENMPLISVIIPVYNVERFLRRCLDSVLGQTYRNLEIILVEDGSTDEYGKICDKRVLVFHNANQGVSAARNCGLDNAKGEYITFVDGDDYIIPDMYEKMLSCIHQTKVEICVCLWQYEMADGRQVVDKSKIDSSILGYKSSLEFARYLYSGSYENGVVVAVWNKLYSRKIFDKLRFEGKLAEDDALNDKVNIKNYSIYIMEEQFYVYVQNSSSLTNATFSVNKFFFLDVLAARQESFFADEFIRQETETLYCNLYIEYCLKARKNGLKIPDFTKYRRIFWYMFEQLCREKKCGLKFRIRMVIFALSPRLYELVTGQ